MPKIKSAVTPLPAGPGIRTQAEARRTAKLQELSSKRESVTRQLQFTPAMGNPDPIWLGQRANLQQSLAETEQAIKNLENLSGDDLIRAMCPDWVESLNQADAPEPGKDHWRIEADRNADAWNSERQADMAARMESIRTGETYTGPRPVEYVMGVDR